LPPELNHFEGKSCNVTTTPGSYKGTVNLEIYPAEGVSISTVARALCSLYAEQIGPKNISRCINSLQTGKEITFPIFNAQDRSLSYATIEGPVGGFRANFQTSESNVINICSSTIPQGVLDTQDNLIVRRESFIGKSVQKLGRGQTGRNS